MTVEEFGSYILRSAAGGDSRDFVSTRAGDPTVKLVGTLASLKAERRKLASLTSECILFRAVKGKVEIEAPDMDLLEKLNLQIEDIDVSIRGIKSKLALLDEHFGPTCKDPTIEGLRRSLQGAKDGIQRYKTHVTQRATQELSFRNDGRWTVDNISQHPMVKAESAKAIPMIERYQADAATLESSIAAVEGILGGE